MRARRALLLVVAAAAVLSGCGIVIQSAAQPIPISSHQFRIGAQGPALRTGRPVDVYFISNNHLVPSTRYVPNNVDTNELLQDTLNDLVLGPTTTEFRGGAVTALSEFPSAQVTVLGSVVAGAASVDLDKSFASLELTQLYEADAQIVYTLTQFAGVTSVILIFGGVREAWLPGGSVVYESVDRADYRSLAPVAK